MKTVAILSLALLASCTSIPGIGKPDQPTTVKQQRVVGFQPCGDCPTPWRPENDHPRRK